MRNLLRRLKNLPALPLLLGALTAVVTVIVLGVIWPGLDGPWRAGLGGALAGIVMTQADRATGHTNRGESDSDQRPDNR